jgi:DNA-binding protein YbaB
MFSKLKQIKELRDKAKEIQGALSQVIIDVEHKGVTVQMDGNQQVRFVKISDELMADKVKLEVAMADAMNESIKKVQKAMAAHLQKMGNLDIPGLS